MENCTDKTNALRKLDQMKIEHKVHRYDSSTAMSGVEVAATLGENPQHVFKTLVTVGKSNAHYVFVIPVDDELDLKKAALIVGEKSVDMLRSKDLLALTGYVHGGCSPIGMKKFFRTTIHSTAKDLDTMFVSGGRIGTQVELRPADLAKVIKFEYADLVKQ